MQQPMTVQCPPACLHPQLPTPLPPGVSPVELIFSNPDLLFANDHPRNRLGQVGLQWRLTNTRIWDLDRSVPSYLLNPSIPLGNPSLPRPSPASPSPPPFPHHRVRSPTCCWHCTRSSQARSRARSSSTGSQTPVRGLRC